MNQTLWSSLTAASLMMFTLGNVPSGVANELEGSDDLSNSKVSGEAQKIKSTFSPVSQPSSPSPLAANSVPASSEDVTKVGEYQSSDLQTARDPIATLFPHTAQGRPAITLYVRAIPVLTFLSTTSEAATEPESSTRSSETVVAGAEVKIGSTQQISAPTLPWGDFDQGQSASNSLPPSDELQHRAMTIAARINQFYLNNSSAETISVRWNGSPSSYVIETNGQPLVEITDTTILPDATQNLAQDALQAANRLRRLLGNAPPLRDVSGLPQPNPQANRRVSVLRTGLSRLSGIASWYGPGFHGNRSASGEVFNQNAMTAAHRSLPFGTQVRVTNLRTGRSVVVRINDRGPFSRGRVIDLSAAAARVIGLLSSGTAPVRLDVIGR